MARAGRPARTRVGTFTTSFALLTNTHRLTSAGPNRVKDLMRLGKQSKGRRQATATAAAAHPRCAQVSRAKLAAKQPQALSLPLAPGRARPEASGREGTAHRR